MNPNTKKSDAASDARKRTVPHPPNFDTLRSMNTLQAAAFSEDQAVTLVETIQDAQTELATKTDLEKTELALRNDMEKMESGIRRDMEKMEAGIRSDMEKMEAGIRSDMEKMEIGIRGDMGKMEAALRGEMKEQFATLYWRLLIGASLITGILGTMITFAGGK